MGDPRGTGALGPRPPPSPGLGQGWGLRGSWRQVLWGGGHTARGGPDMPLHSAGLMLQPCPSPTLLGVGKLRLRPSCLPPAWTWSWHCPRLALAGCNCPVRRNTVPRGAGQRVGNWPVARVLSGTDTEQLCSLGQNWERKGWTRWKGRRLHSQPSGRPPDPPTGPHILLPEAHPGPPPLQELPGCVAQASCSPSL